MSITVRTNVGSAIASFEDLVTLHMENTTKQTSKYFGRESAMAPLDLITVNQERELYKPNSRTKHGSFVVLIISLIRLMTKL